MPLFSIITVTYNAEHHLENTIKSVLSQSCSDIEYIIIDGASTDGTKDILKRYEKFLDYWVSEPDEGLYYAMNKGLQVATGDYVWFLNAGDALKSPKLTSQLAEIALQNNKPDILYGETNLIDDEGITIGARRLKTPKELTWKSFKMGMLVSHQAFIAKRNVAPKYDLNYRFSADFDWCIRCMKEAKTIINTKLRLVNYLYEGLTTNNREASLKERYEIMCKYYGIFPTQIRHLWFTMRFYWTKLFKNKNLI